MSTAPDEQQQQQQQLQEYLERIGLQSPPAELSVDSLTLLHRQHALSIPFENLLFVHHKLKGDHRPVDIGSLHKRLVLRKRGGMCQEQNALLLHNLKLLGYNAYAGLAMMVVDFATPPPASNNTPLTGPPTSTQPGATQTCFGAHQIVIVTLEGRRYLCDVGAGGKCIVEPILLRAYDDVDSSSDGGWQPPPPADWLSAKGEYRQYGMRYRLRRGVMGSAEPLAVADVASHPERDSWVGWYLQHCIKGSWTDMYWFSLTPVSNQVLQACSDNSFKNHPLFTRHMVASCVVPGGRSTLLGFELTTRIEGHPTEKRTLAGEEERDAALQEVFGLDLAGPPLPAGC